MRGKEQFVRRFVVAMAPLVLTASIAQGQWHYYYFKAKQPLRMDVGRVAILRTEAGDVAAGGEGLASFGLDKNDVEPWPVKGWFLAGTTAGMRTPDAVQQIVREMSSRQAADFVSPVFVDKHGGPIIITQDILVGFKQHIDGARTESVLAEMDAGVIEERDWSRMKGVYRLRSESRDGFEVLETANALAQHPDISFAEPDMFIPITTAALIPNDPGFGFSWGLHNTGQDGGTPDADMDAPEAWEITLGDPSIIVVVLDSGVQQDHPDLNQIPGNDFTGTGTDGGPQVSYDVHGTLVAGCVSAIINNAVGTVGVAPECKIASARFNIGGNIGQPSWLVAALDWAQTIGAQVTNSSFLSIPSSTVANKYSATREAGIIHFAAAGNAFVPGDIGFPANLPPVNAVAALARDGDLWWNSLTGVGIGFCAPGDAIYTTDRTGPDGLAEGDYVTVSGTSFATPYTAGVAALVLSLDPNLSPMEVEQVLQDTAIDLGAPGYDTRYGWGFVNALRAVARGSIPLTLCNAGKLTASDAGPGDEFGKAVSLSDDVAVIGAHLDDDRGVDAGAVYVYRRTGITWGDEHKIFAVDTTAGDGFGHAVAISGDEMIVGAPGNDHSGEVDAGSAYVFRRDGSSWTAQQKLIASDAAMGDAFGWSVAVDGDVAVVGAVGDDDGAAEAGAAYIYRYDGNIWNEEQKLSAFDPAPLDSFGFSVSVSGDVVVASSPNDGHAGSGSGSVYAYRWTGSGWEDGKLTASDAAAGDGFGRSVFVRGDDLIIGAYGDDEAGSNAGSVYWFEWTGSAWAQRQEFFASDAAENDRFGQSVSIASDRVVVGADRDDTAASDAGAVYVFRRSDGWVEEAELLSLDAATDDSLGGSVAISGSYAVAGARWDDHGATPDAGSAYILAVAGDCNHNEVVDTCDILGDSDLDLDDDGLIDSCTCAGSSPPDTERRLDLKTKPIIPKCRVLSVKTTDAGQNQAIRVRFVDLPSPFDVLNGSEYFVGKPIQVCENAGQGLETPAPDGCSPANGLPRNWFWSASLVCEEEKAYFMDWHGVCDGGTCFNGLKAGESCTDHNDCVDFVHIQHEGIVPKAVYEIQVVDRSCLLQAADSYSPPLTLPTTIWGDIVEDCVGDLCGPPDGVVNITTDVTGALDKFKNLDGAPTKARCDVEPAVLDHKINISDVTEVLNAFLGFDYPFDTVPEPCP